MPVLLTITIVNLFFRFDSGDERPGFLNPAELRNALEQIQDPAVRRDALLIMDRIEALAKRITADAYRALDAYEKDVERYDSTLDELQADLIPLNEVPVSLLPELILLRDELRDTLSDEDWRQVFG